MTDTEKFQRDVADKVSQYLLKKINDLQANNNDLYRSLEQEYELQLRVVRATANNHNIIQNVEINKNLITCLSEPITNYRLGDLTEREADDEDDIYSPRIDIAITPTVVRNRTKKVSFGIYRLDRVVRLFDLLHGLDFIGEVERKLKDISDINYRSNVPMREGEMNVLVPMNFINSRPMHLFGFEIENQKNPKHLMGDFLNAISLSRIPIVIMKEERFIDCMKMLRFSKTIEYIKEVPVYNLLSKTMVLTVDQFRNVMNELLIAENIEPIRTTEYR